MAASPAPTGANRLGETQRRDAWWIELLPVIFIFGGFGLYATLRAFEGKFYEWGPYLSPFYSPLIDRNHHWWSFSPALLILGGPLGFRTTCYYYRKAYYRAFFLDPPGCAVSENSNRKYKGETAFPFILQNIHRYFLYLAILFLIFLWYDAVRAYIFDSHFGIGLGSLLMTANVSLLSLYTFSCHSLRHLVGGVMNQLSRSPARKKVYDCASCLNRHHPKWAWFSLVFVGFTDVYVRLCSMGVITDLRIL